MELVCRRAPRKPDACALRIMCSGGGVQETAASPLRLT